MKIVCDKPWGTLIGAIDHLDDDDDVVFFPHWSKKVPVPFLERNLCIGFHMTDLPYGRGGTPLQNLIVRGFTETTVCMFQMTSEMDAGPVYMRWSLSLEGTAQQIYERLMGICKAMIDACNPTSTPVPQEGEPVYFKRLRENRIPRGLTPEQFIDRVRMTDAEGYPKAFIDHGGTRIEFTMNGWSVTRRN